MVFGKDKYKRQTFAQEGEDRVLMRAFGKKNGFYVDVGAHHPQRHSNTYLFYKKGWHGINIDAQPGTMKAFEKIRSRDTNLEMAIGEEEGVQSFFIFKDGAFNTFDEAIARQRQQEGVELDRVVELPVRRLESVLREYLEPGEQIDFLSVDVEGLDLPVVRSNDWQAFRPEFVLAESLNSDLDGLMDSPLTRFMDEQGYGLYAKTVNTVFYRRR